jgi:PAS domain S-box-containing protein
VSHDDHADPGELAAAHRETQAQKELTEHIVQGSSSGISYLDRNLVYQWVNPVQERLWGLPAAQVVGRRVQDVFGLAEDDQILRLLRDVLATGKPCRRTDFPFSYVVDGKPRASLWDFLYQPVLGRDQEVVGVVVTAEEVSERRRAIFTLRESEERYRGLFEVNLDAIVMLSLDRTIEDVNPAFNQLFGYAPGEAIGQSTGILYPDRQGFEEAGRVALGDLTRLGPISMEVTMRRADGTTLPVQITSYLQRDAQGQPVRVVAVLRDLTLEHEARRQSAAYHRELASQKAFAESLIQNLPTGVAYLDRDLVFRVVNPVYAAFVEVPAEQIVDRFLFDVLPADRSQIEPILREVLATGKPFYAREFPFVYTTQAGVERTTYWDFVYYPVRNDESEPVQGIFALADEISERVERDREQRRLREEGERLQRERLEALEQADKLKDQFLSILSHELRTPINAIMGFGSILEDEVAGPLTAEQHTYTGKILAGADTLLALIEDLLIVSRVQAGKFSIRPEPAPLRPLVASALETQQLAAQRKGITLATEPGEELLALADPQRISQVLLNLVANAIKFTPAGGRVTVRLRREGDQARCEVQDTGVGIAPADQPKLFQRFVQLDMSNTRAAGGTGLGLSIVKAIVDAHGGGVGVESVPGHGSTFWFTVPLA